ncbi:septal ring lytic transglycosylase RlpA family protein (plasmid) [Skermanella mucosa]|uniref:septal ring lytic transglycosylase RlpA family protein n=1 Tax=Skermanella mucosa TaxID=1789672 RepID=UPI00192B4FD5|nr:septal ring lytic transglycosylase RlpA family protein [Skermanella mucosa]UEM25082.1 septal ring lytic transglycosylase RlpA family protein [Skermanella mucosa]
MRKLMLPIAAILLTTQPLAAQESSKVIRQEGQASYFQAGEGGNTLTKSGEPVNPQGYTAASRDLPLGTVVTVTNRETGKSVDVRINDRGPTRPDRIIDVSEQAARDLGMEEAGVAPVTVEADPGRQDDPEIRSQLESAVR